tara:strand:+ start:82 stop:822 length:741 start_codon:yes stop_codon:yes gene_type:complete
MFNFLKKTKPNISEIISNDFVDIHSHILPGIDDGAQNLKESRSLISQMCEMGFKKIIGTPHTYPGLYDNTNQTIESSYFLLNNLVTNVELDYASEYMVDFSLIMKAKKKSLMTLKDNYVLIEMSYISEPANFFEIIFELQMQGYQPILAHPERYRFLHGNMEKYKKLKKIGCKFQINLLSCTQYYGKDIMRITEKIIDENLIDYVGSDIHNQNHINFFKSKDSDKKIGIRNIDKLQNLIENNNWFK